jgi:hypothetical protein
VGLRPTHAAEAHVQGGYAVVEESAKLQRSFPLIALVEKPTARHVGMVGPVGRPPQDVFAEGV